MNPTLAPSASQKSTATALIETVALFGKHNDRLLNLAQTISHNLNAYVGNIQSLTDIIDSEEEPEERKIAVAHLRTVTADLKQTIAHLSEIVRIQNTTEVEKIPLNLKDYITKIEHTINGYTHQHKAVFSNHVADAVMVNFNPAYLESVLLNFVTNAIKYAHPDRFPSIEFNFYEQQEQKILTITDNGLGINLDRYGDSLFGLYKTFHPHEDANGFGLYITKYQIESMNGKVTVSSKVDEGTTFKIFFYD
jgi:K+-sensing histidine kinase KdpD